MLDLTKSPDDVDAVLNERIAMRVRELRAAHELTLDLLASRSGVSRSMISLIERGAASPTAVVLNKLATGLGVSLASLFAGAEPDEARPQPFMPRARQAIWKDPESGYLRRSLSPPAWPSPMQLTEVQFPAGARVAYESGPRATALHQQVWMLQGQVDILLGDASHSLRTGDCLAMRLDGPIVFSNPGKLAARYLVATCDAATFTHPTKPAP